MNVLNSVKPLAKPIFYTVAALTLLVGLEVSVVGVQEAKAQQAEQPKRKTRTVQSIRQKHVKAFEKIQEVWDAENIPEMSRLLDKLAAEPDLNNIEKAYLHNYRGNICFRADNLNCALREFKLVTATREGISDNFYNQMLYVIAQVYFSQENYREALNYAQTWFKTQQDPSADAYMLIGQAYYMLKEYDRALPNVQKGIQKYIDVGSVPKEGWLNLLSGIYREKNQYRNMLPVVKQLVQHYPKKTYLLTLGGVYNELNEPAKMTAMYQAMYDQGLLNKENEIATLASLLLSHDNPYKAAMIMEKGINDGVVSKKLKNYRMYSQALYMAKEYEKALGPLAKAAALDKNGKLFNQLGQSYIALNRWSQAESALGKAIRKGGLSNTGQTMISLGLVQFEQKKYDSAKATFKRALKHQSVAPTALNWVKYVEAEEYRIRELNKPIIINTDVEPATT